MSVVAVYSDQDVDEMQPLSSAADDGGVCREVESTETINNNKVKVTDYTANSGLGMAAGLRLLDIYANPDPQLKNLITTPGGQKIWVYAQIVECGEAQTVKSSKLLNDTFINGAWFLAGQKITFHESLAMSSGTLRDDVEFVPGIWFKAKTEASFAADETLVDNAHFESGILCDDENFYGIKFSAGTKASFHPNGKFKTGVLSEDTIINGILFARFHEVEFDEEGNLARGTLREPTKFNDILWPAFAEVEFHPNGEFRGSVLAAMTPVKLGKSGSNTLIAGTRVEYHDNNQIALATPLKDFALTVNGQALWIKGSNPVEYFANGNIKNAVLRDPVTINGIDLAAGSIAFFENGQIERAILAHDLKVPHLKIDVTFMGGHEFEFDEEGNFHGGDTKYPLTLTRHLDDDGKPIVIKAERFVSFYSDGTFRGGRLLKETTLDGLPLAAGSKIKFHEDKKLKSGVLARDTSVFDDVYDGAVVFTEGTECGYTAKDELRGTLKYDISFEVELDDKTVTLTAQAGKEVNFFRNSDRIQGGTLKSAVTLWSDVIFAEDEWFEIDMTHSDYFTRDLDDEDTEFVGGVLKYACAQDGHELPKGKYAEFYTDGNVRAYSVEDEFDYDPDLYPGLILGGDRWVEFYPGGTQIKGGKLAVDFEPFPDIYFDRDNPLMFAKDSWVGFDEDGIMTGGKLAQDFYMEHEVFGSIFLKAGEWVDITEDGMILGGRLEEDTELYLPGFDDLVLAGGEWVEFDEDGSLLGAKLSEDTVYHYPIYGALKFKAGTRIEFNPDGTLKGGILAKPVTIMNSRYGQIDLIADEWFELHETGEFKSGTLKDDLYIINDRTGNFSIVDGETATFYPAENLQYGILADQYELMTIAGMLEFEAYSEIEIGEDDEALSGYVAKKYTIGGDDYRVGEWVDLMRYWPE